jgi:hypothetical protein
MYPFYPLLIRVRVPYSTDDPVRAGRVTKFLNGCQTRQESNSGLKIQTGHPTVHKTMPCQLFAGLACAIPICGGGGGACCCPALAAAPCCGCAPMPICNAACCCVPLPCCAIPPLCLASWYHWKHSDDYNPEDRVDTESRRRGHYRHGAVSSVPESKYMPLDDTTTFRLEPHYYSSYYDEGNLTGPAQPGTASIRAGNATLSPLRDRKQRSVIARDQCRHSMS